jgi:hypothetical protein
VRAVVVTAVFSKSQELKPVRRLCQREPEAAKIAPDLLLIWIGVTAGPWVLIGLVAYGLRSVL